MSTEKIRKLTNDVVLRGKLAELDVFEGTTKEKNEKYLRVRGAIQFGEHPVSTKRFDMFAKEKTSAGKKSAAYNNLQHFVDTAIPMTLNKEDPTVVGLRGELVPNDYVNVENELVEGINIRGAYFEKDYDTEAYPATYTIEGYIMSLTDEIKNDEPTGRKKMTLLTTNYSNEAVVIKNIIIPADIVEDFEDVGYEQGVSSMFYIALIPHIAEAKTSKGGFGKKVATTGASYLELILTGGEDIYDEDDEKAIDSKTAKALLKERNIKLDELKENGYQGENSSKTTKSSATKGAAKKAVETPIDEDDLPF